MRGGIALFALAFSALALSGCTGVITQSTFFPPSAVAPDTMLTAPAGYRLEEAMLDLPGLGAVHAVRLDNPASNTAVVYAGGNMSFVARQAAMAAALAGATSADLVFYDYPGRGGTSVPATVDGSIAFGPAFVQALKARGWIGAGPVFAYGLSFGGSQAAAIARAGGMSGLIIEGSAADLARVGRNFIPAIAKPFVRLRVDPDLARFDYAGYAVAARAPVLLITSEQDKVVTPANMRDFADQLRARGVSVTTVSVPGRHGTALDQPAALDAVRRFVASKGG